VGGVAEEGAAAIQIVQAAQIAVNSLNQKIFGRSFI
jgi:hypothetical protein